VAVETALAGAAGVTVANRSAERGAELARIVTVATGVPARFAPLCDGLEVSSEIDVVVNATSVGMGAPGHAVPIDWSHARAGVVAADVVIDPRTLFLAQAEEAGARTLDGLGMLVEQAAIGLRWWTGVEPDRTVMRAALADAMQLAP
jgi:shikimate dehydrogenase